MSDAGKGDDPRPLSIPRKEYDKNYDRIFYSYEVIEEEVKLALDRMANNTKKENNDD